MKKLRFFPLLLATLWLISCSKDPNDPSAQIPGNLSNLKVAQSFNWSTSKTIEISITGLPTPAPLYSTLTLSLPDGSNIYKSTHDINTNETLKVVIPSTENSIRLRFGSVEHDLQVSDGKASFSFIPVVQD